jgi:hypothetical protein
MKQRWRLWMGWRGRPTGLGYATAIWREIHSADGCEITATCRMSRRSWLRTTKAQSRLNVTDGTTKKSQAAVIVARRLRVARRQRMPMPAASSCVPVPCAANAA